MSIWYLVWTQLIRTIIGHFKVQKNIHKKMVRHTIQKNNIHFVRSVKWLIFADVPATPFCAVNTGRTRSAGESYWKVSGLEDHPGHSMAWHPRRWLQVTQRPSWSHKSSRSFGRLHYVLKSPVYLLLCFVLIRSRNGRSANSRGLKQRRDKKEMRDRMKHGGHHETWGTPFFVP